MFATGAAAVGPGSIDSASPHRQPTLSAADLDLLSTVSVSGESMPTMSTVTSRPDWDWGRWDWDWGRWDGGYDYNTSSSDPGGSSGGGGNQPPQKCVASQTAAAIQNDPKFSTGEIGAVLYVDSVTGELRSTPMQYAEAATPWKIDLQLTAHGVEPSEVVGIVHSQPDSVFHTEPSHVNRYPSVNDWAAADLLAQHGMNSAGFHHYVFGSDNVLRAYSFHDRDTTSLGQQVTNAACQ